MHQNYAPHQPVYQQQWKPRNGFGTSSLVLGVAAATAALCSPPVGQGITLSLILGVLGVVFGYIGIQKAKAGSATNLLSAIAGVTVSPAAFVISLVVYWTA